MKMLTPCKSFFAVAVAALTFAACNPQPKEVIEKHYIQPSDAYCMFNSTNNQSLQLTVVSNPTDWEASTEDSWLHLRDKKDNSIILEVDDNTEEVERRGTVTLSAGEARYDVEVVQMAKDSSFARYRQMLKFQMGAVISPSGKYAGGFYAELAPNESILYQPVIIDLETDEWIMPGPYPESLAALWMPTAITDDGTLFFDTEAGGPRVFDINGDNYLIDTPEGFYGTPSISSVSADGTWVGWCMKRVEGEEDALYVPVKWVNGVAKEMPVPEKSYRDEKYVNGVMARSISANGEIVTGTTWDNLDFGMVYWDKNGDVFYVGKDFRKVKTVKRLDDDGNEYDYNLVDGITCMSGSMQVSPNGRWIAGTYRSETLDPVDRKSIVEEYHAAFYNTETEQVYIIDDYGDSMGRGVTDDGLGFVNLGHEMCSRGVVVDIESGMELGTAAEWVKEKYGIVIPEGYLMYASADGKITFGITVVGTAMGAEDCCWYVAPALEN